MPPRVNYWRFQWRDANGFAGAWRRHTKLIILTNLGTIILAVFFAAVFVLLSHISASPRSGTWSPTSPSVGQEKIPKNVIVRIEQTVHAPYPLEDRITSLFNQYKLVHESCVYVLQSKCQNGRLISAPGHSQNTKPKHEPQPPFQEQKNDGEDNRHSQDGSPPLQQEEEEEGDKDNQDICTPPLVNGTLHRTTLALLTSIYTDISDTAARHVHTHRRTYRAQLLALYRYLRHHRHTDEDIGLAQALLLQPIPLNNGGDDDLDNSSQSSLVGLGFVSATESMRAARRAVKKLSPPAQAVETTAEIMLGVQTTFAARAVHTIQVGWDFAHRDVAEDLKLLGSGQERKGDKAYRGGDGEGVGDGETGSFPGLKGNGIKYNGHGSHRDGKQGHKTGGSDGGSDGGYKNGPRNDSEPGDDHNSNNKTFHMPSWIKTLPSNLYSQADGTTRHQWDHWVASLVLRYLFGKDGASWNEQREQKHQGQRHQHVFTLDDVDKTDLQDVSSTLAKLRDALAPVEAHLIRFEQVTAAWYAGEELGFARAMNEDEPPNNNNDEDDEVGDDDGDEDDGEEKYGEFHDVVQSGVTWLTNKFSSLYMTTQQAQKTKEQQHQKQRRRQKWDELRRVRMLTQLALTDVTRAHALLEATMQEWDDLAQDLVDLVNGKMMRMTHTDEQVGMMIHRSVTITVYTLPEPLVFLNTLLRLTSELLAYQEDVGKVRDQLRTMFPSPEFGLA